MVPVVNIWMLVNPAAGSGVSKDDLRRAVEDGGHTVVEISGASDSARKPDPGVDLAVVAGGDGTVAAAAALVVGSPTPLAILPLGTANNIATALGLAGCEIADLIAGWSSARRVPFDVAWARTRTAEWLVVEGVGAGLVPAGIAAVEGDQDQAVDNAPTAAGEVGTAVRMFTEIAIGLQPSRWSIVIDGTRVEEDLLMFEILNIPAVGPNLELCSTASPTDGYLDVVLADRSHREEIVAFLSGETSGTSSRLTLPTRQARSVTIEGCDALHIDDKRVETCGLGEITITIAPGALTVLCNRPLRNG
jgi:diacylglycerol kinase family enzyme